MEFNQPVDPVSIALQFNAQINAHDLTALSALMSPDHRFIDRDGQVTAGKGAMLDAWQRFFACFPDYQNTFTQVESRGDLVVMRGFATWEAGAAPDHAIWTARIEGGLVAEWRIGADNEENRNRLGFGESND